MTRRAFLAATLLLTLLSLWPVWQRRFPPMQDYPQHVFLAHVMGTANDPRFDWAEHYRVSYRPGPYSAGYLVVWALSHAVDTETAAKLLLSIYVLLVAALALTMARRNGGTAWPALLLFPLAFHPMWYLGFLNFIVAVPLLMFAVLDLERVAARPASAGSFLRHLPWPVLLFLFHPYMAAVYVALGLAGALAHVRRPKALARAAAPALVVLAAFAVWFALAPAPSPDAMGEPWGMRWWPASAVASFFALTFTGMRITNGVDWPVTAGWIAAAALIAGSALRKGGTMPSVALRLCLAAALAGYAALPFWFSYYSYFNVRLAPIALFLAAMCLAGVRMAPAAAGTLVAVIAGLLVLSAGQQRKVSDETAEILPLLERMEPNACVLPLPFRTGSAALDPAFFYQMHYHDPCWYHVVVGGGADPTLFPNAWLPVQYRAGVELPKPDVLTHFTWEDYQPYYDYVIARGAPKGFVEYLSDYLDVARSGEWTLFGPNPTRGSDPTAATGSPANAGSTPADSVTRPSGSPSLR